MVPVVKLLHGLVQLRTSVPVVVGKTLGFAPPHFNYYMFNVALRKIVRQFTLWICIKPPMSFVQLRQQLLEFHANVTGKPSFTARITTKAANGSSIRKAYQPMISHKAEFI